MKALLISFLFAFCISGQEISFAGSIAPEDLKALKLLSFSPPEKAPDFSLKDLEGKDTTLAAHRGKPVMLYFWATW